MAKRLNVKAFIQAHLRLLPVPSLPEIQLYAAHPGSGLSRLADPDGTGDDRPPYWAFQWAGGAVLARFVLDLPQNVAGLRVLDLGAGSGVVAIAAKLSGAREAIAADIDSNAMAAIALNAQANGVVVAAICEDLTAGAPPPVDVVLVGDLFYDAATAGRVTAFLDRCLAAGIRVLVGDPGRAHLPHPQLRQIADYAVPDFADVKGATPKLSAVFEFVRAHSEKCDALSGKKSALKQKI